MQNIQKLLEGKKTYLSALAIAVTVFLFQAGLIDQAAYETVLALLGALGLAALRAGVSK